MLKLGHTATESGSSDLRVRACVRSNNHGNHAKKKPRTSDWAQKYMGKYIYLLGTVDLRAAVFAESVYTNPVGRLLQGAA